MSDHQKPDLSKSGLNRQIRVFISSTFRDMHEERNYLATHIFPQLRKLCDQRGVVWGEVDLRWGINDEQKAEGKVLPICLKEIERCRPYFIGILGERYGWVPHTIPHDLIDSEKWLEEHFGKTGKSVTELEILHGVINNPKMAEHAFFYFRDPSYIESIPEEKRNDFTAEGTEDAEKLKRLKERIRNGNFPVRENYQHPKELGALVLKDLTDVINKDFPEGSQPDPLDREAYEHEIFARSRTITEVRHGEFSGVYIGRPEYFKRLDEHAEGDGQPLVILGESGAGKSALLANWALQYRQKHNTALQRQKTTLQSPPSQGGDYRGGKEISSFRFPPYEGGDKGEVKDFPKNYELFIMHFIGSTPHSADWMAMLRRIMGEFKHRFDIQGDIPDKPDALRQAFANWLHMAAAKGRVVLILDALNQLEDRDGSPDLVWLPPVMPENIRLILSTLPGRPLNELKGRKWDTLTVEPLTQDERGVFIEKYLAQYTKSLHPDYAMRIAAAGQTSNPLYLRTLLEELRLYGDHLTLGNKIGYYLEAKDPYELYTKVLIRWEEAYEDGSDLVGDSMSLIWASRRGLTEQELLELLGTEDKPLPRAMWSPLYLAAEGSFVNRSGLLNFFHDYLRDAVRDTYIPAEESQQVHLRLADYFSKLELFPLSKGGEGVVSNARKVDELPWQLAQAKACQGLYDLLSNLPFFEAAWCANKFEVKAYWVHVEENSSFRMVEAYREVLNNPTVHHDDQIWLLARLLDDTGHPAESMSLRAYLVVRCRQGNDLNSLQATLGGQANILRVWGDLEGAMKLHKEQEHICKELGNKDGIQMSLGNQAVILQAWSDLEGAMKLYKEQERICKEIGNKDHLSASLGNQALIHVDWGDLESAMKLLKEEERICKEMGNKDGLQISLCNQANILRVWGDLDGAMKLYKEQERICKDLGNKEGLAISLANQAGLLNNNMHKSDEALLLAEEAYRIATDHGLTALAQRIKPILDAIKNPSRISKPNKEEKKPPELSSDGKLICPVCTQKSQQGATFCIWCKHPFR